MKLYMEWGYVYENKRYFGILTLRSVTLCLSLALLTGLAACKSTPQAQSPATAVFHGTWEGNITVNESFSYKAIIDCLVSSDVDKVLLSVAGIGDQDIYYWPVDFETDDGALKIWFNEEANRAEIKFNSPDDGQLTGILTQRGQSSNVTFVKISDTPTDGEFQVKVKLREDLVGLLRVNSDFNRADARHVVFEYEYDHPKLAEIRNKYGLEGIAGGGDTLSKAVKLLNWVSGGTHHNGNYNHPAGNALALLEYAFNQGSEKGLNCKNLANILSEVYISVGIQARPLFLMPQSSNDMDNHVAVMAWIPEKHKWIMLDPSYNAYLSDLEGNILSPVEVREKLASGEAISLNPDAKVDYAWYLNYLAKDMFYFFSVRKTGFGTLDGISEIIYLCPNGFDRMEWEIENMRYRNPRDNAQNGAPLMSNEELAKREENIRQKEYKYATYESFWSR